MQKSQVVYRIYHYEIEYTQDMLASLVLQYRRLNAVPQGLQLRQANFFFNSYTLILGSKLAVL